MRKLIGSGHLAQRPQGMHRRTFEKLSGELDSLVALSTMRLAESLGITVKSEQSLPADGKRSGMAAPVMNRRQLPLQAESNIRDPLKRAAGGLTIRLGWVRKAPKPPKPGASAEKRVETPGAPLRPFWRVAPTAFRPRLPSPGQVTASLRSGLRPQAQWVRADSRLRTDLGRPVQRDGVAGEVVGSNAWIIGGTSCSCFRYWLSPAAPRPRILSTAAQTGSRPAASSSQGPLASDTGWRHQGVPAFDGYLGSD